MRALFALSDGWFLAAWWLLAVIAVGAMAVFARWLRFPNGGPTLEEGDPITGHDLPVINSDPLSLSPGEVALVSLLHREILAIDDEGKLQPGARRLGASAHPLEAWIVQRASASTIRKLVQAADARNLPVARARLRSRGLLALPQVALAERFVHVCMLLSLLTIGGVRLWWWWPLLSPEHVIGLVSSMAAMSWWFSHVIRRRPSVPTGRARRAIGRITAAHPLPASLVGWPAPDTPASQVELVAGLWGMSPWSRGAFARLRAAIAGRRIPPEGAKAEPSSETLRTEPLVDEALVQQLLLPTPPSRLERVGARATWVVLAAAITTLGLMAWISSSTGPPSLGQRGGAVFEQPSVKGVDALGMTRPLEPMPAPRRGTRPAACDPAAAMKAAQSVFGILAEHERAHETVDEILEPHESRPPTPTHTARPGQIFAATNRSLFELVLHEDQRVTVREIAPVRVNLPAMGNDRLVTPFVMHTTVLQSLAFDPEGWLWATGDERLYVCGVGTAICVPEGIVPADTRAVAFSTLAAGEAPVLVAVRSGGVVERLERVAAPRWLGEAGGAVVARTELCTRPGPSHPAVVVGPVEDREGTAHVILRRGEGFVSTILRNGEPVEPGLDLPPEVEPVALVPLDDGVLLLSSTGHILLAGSGALRLVATTGRAWRAAAAYLGPGD